MTMRPASAVLAELLAGLRALPPVTMPLTEAAGHVLAGDVLAPTPLPPQARAAMDGIAVRAVDVAGARPGAPVRLAVDGASMAGRGDVRPLAPGTARDVATGAPIPPGADAIVRVEELRREEGHAVVSTAVAGGRDVRPAGGDAVLGEVLLPTGTKLGAAALGGLAGAGVEAVVAIPVPRVVVLPTGDEVVAGTTPDAVGPALRHLLANDGANVIVGEPVPDDLAALSRAVLRHAEHADVVATVGGVSVGQRDHAAALVASLPLGESMSVAVRPARPFAWGRAEGGCTVVCLPGSPVAALVSAVLFVRPVVATLAGRPPPEPSSVTLGAVVAGQTDRRCLVPASCVRGGAAHPLPGHGAADLARLARTQVLLDLPAGTGELRPGVRVAGWLLP